MHRESLFASSLASSSSHLLSMLTGTITILSLEREKENCRLGILTDASMLLSSIWERRVENEGRPGNLSWKSVAFDPIASLGLEYGTPSTCISVPSSLLVSGETPLILTCISSSVSSSSGTHSLVCQSSTVCGAYSDLYRIFTQSLI